MHFLTPAPLSRSLPIVLDGWGTAADVGSYRPEADVEAVCSPLGLQSNIWLQPLSEVAKY